ncbi:MULTISPECIES: hypothetical protein [unclassified Caballeronia]|uniref:hypothetical protein n=1 Tax=unclassified Caballeronia TaxID=2646786 RepID=UPI002860F01B|nr:MULTISPECIES: hypothetical protein [unclassified Caballeronia]MDR5770863.1 hypothetical protein [Caballeronia sp. LZ002]MDR5846300.1 hypothetical protein [Caballeronia sp. LZ003]
MLIRDLKALTPEQSKAARVLVFAGDLYGGWTVWINGQPLCTTNNSRRRVFNDLDTVAAMLKRAKIPKFTVDIDVGDWRPRFEVPPMEIVARAVDNVVDRAADQPNEAKEEKQQ